MAEEVNRSGDFTWYERNGKRVMRKRHNDKGNPSKSELQDANRRRWKNSLNLWAAFVNCQWKPRYQDKKPGQNDYNRFMALAAQGTKIYLTKAEASNCASVLVPLTISDGTLPTIVAEFDGTGVRSNISVGDLAIDAETRVCDLAYAIMFGNQGFQKGDTITYVAGSQGVRSLYGPQVIFRSCVLPLDLDDQRTLAMLPFGSEAFGVREGFIASSVSQGACTWVHERKVSAGGKTITYCSKQTMWCRNDEMIALYSGQAAREASMASYGKHIELPMLTPQPLPEDLVGKM